MTLQFPSSPTNDQVYENYIYNSTAGAWQKLPGNAFADAAVSDTPPVNPNNGDLWLNSADAKMYIYYNDGDSSQWIAAVGGTVPSQGKILQVVSTVKTNTETISTGTFTAVSGLSVAITPSSTSSKILIMVSLFGTGSSTGAVPAYRISGGNAGTFIGDAGLASQQRAAGLTQSAGPTAQVSMHLTFLDSPATTSSVTYAVEWNRGSSGTAYIGRTVNNSNDSDNSRTASSITVMEVAG